MKEMIDHRFIAKETTSYLSTLSGNDKVALRTWAKNAKLEN